MKPPKKYDSKTAEKEKEEKWKNEETYTYDPCAARENTFVVDTPPPTVSGDLHIGHVFSYTQTDIIARFHRMLGKNIFYPMGWDDNGLPTERRVQNIFGISCDSRLPYDKNFIAKEREDQKLALTPISRRNFIEICKKQTADDEIRYESLWRRLGLSVDWNQKYETINEHCRKVSQKSFLDIAEKWQAYNQFAPTLWDTGFKTAVAQADVEDREVNGFFYNIKFSTSEGSEIEIATTRPELLAACIAIVAHPDDDKYKPFFGKIAISPLFHAEIPIIPSEHADPEKGTGILMVCTFGDIEDVKFYRERKLPMRQIIGEDGRFLHIEFGKANFSSQNANSANEFYQTLIGKTVKQARKQTVEMLKDNGFLASEPRATQQFVKFYEKGDLPLEYIPARQWFIRLCDKKHELIEQGRKIKWQPEAMRQRYEQWVEGLNQDWCISRQRYFGVAFPVWYPIDGMGIVNYEAPIYAREEDLPVDPLIDCPNGFDEKQRGEANGFVADTDVMDTWATSSMTPQINSHWGHDEKRHESLFPADLRPQAHEIIRTWAFYTIAKSWLHEEKIPWKNIAISGWVVDPSRSKISKSKGGGKGQISDPNTLIDNYSADAVRYWAGKARLGNDTIFDESVFKIGRRLSTKLFNAAKFVMMQIEGSALDHAKESLVVNQLDKSWLHSLRQMTSQATEHFESFRSAEALELIEKCFWNFCDNYLELVKGRAYQQKKHSEGLSAIATLDFSLSVFVRCFAPFLPFMTEEIWSWRFKEITGSDSVHKSNWPQVEEFELYFIGENDQSLKIAIQILEAVRNEKSEKKVSLASEVEELEIFYSENLMQIVLHLKADLERSCRVNEGGFKVSQGKGSEKVSVKVVL